MDGMERNGWKGSFLHLPLPLFSPGSAQRGRPRPPCRATLWRRRASLWNGATGRTEGGRGRQRQGGRKKERRSQSRGPLPPSEESNRGTERRGKSKPTKLLLLPSRLYSLLLSSTLLTSPPHAPLSPPLPCGASFVLPPFLPANYIIYADIHGMKEIHSRRGISKVEGSGDETLHSRHEISPARTRTSLKTRRWMDAKRALFVNDRSPLPLRSFAGSFAAVPPAPVPIDCDRRQKRPVEVTTNGV